MPRASWRGFLRLSLVSCPVYLAPTTSRAKPIRLHQVWRPVPERSGGVDEESTPDRSPEQRARRRSVSTNRDFGETEDETAPLSRITIRPHDPATGVEVDKGEVVKGYEYERGRFVTFTKDELKVLDLESSKAIDLETFVPRREIDPIYLDSSYYLYPEGEIAVQTMCVIGAAMTERNVAGIGRLVLSRRERAVIVRPRGSGMVLFTLHTAEEMRPAALQESAGGAVDPEMVAIAGAIIEQRLGHFDPRRYSDRYQAALHELIDAKMRGLPVKPPEVQTPAPVVDLMAALRRSLAAESAGKGRKAAAAPKRRKSAGDRRQGALLLPLAGAKKSSQAAAGAAPGSAATRRTKA
jgi:DNA end-binding protein Ku